MNVTELLDELGITYIEEGHHHCTPNFVQIDCPWCSPNSDKWRMGVHRYLNYCSCWICGSHALNRTLQEILYGSTIRLNSLRSLLPQLEGEKVTTPTPRGKLVLPANLGDLKPAHKEYLRNRGIDPDSAARLWGLKGIGTAPQLAWRIFIPAIHRGETVSWTTRALATSSNGTKYISARPDQERVSIKTLLNGSDVARHAIIIVEGPLDRIRIGTGAVDTAGVNYSRSQVKEMTRFPVRWVCFDNEPDAQRRARTLCDELSCYPGKTGLVQIDAKDPGSASDKEIRQLRRLLR